MKPKQINEWSLTPDYRDEVKKQIRAWINHFNKQADGRTGTARHLDFKNNNVLFFTDCQDLIQSDNPNKEIKIRKRKRYVLQQLFLRYLINDEIKIERPSCGRCGHNPIDSIPVGNTFMTVCPKCGKLNLHGDLHSFGFNANAVIRLMKDGELDQYKKLTGEK